MERGGDLGIHVSSGCRVFPMPELSFYGSISSYFNPVTTTYSPTVMYLDRKGNEFNPDEDGGRSVQAGKGVFHGSRCTLHLERDGGYKRKRVLYS